MKILGLGENMSGLRCPHCNGLIDLFKSNRGLVTAQKENLCFLGCLPLEPEAVQSGDLERFQVLENIELAFTQAFSRMVDTIETSIQPGLDFDPNAVVGAGINARS